MTSHPFHERLKCDNANATDRFNYFFFQVSHMPLLPKTVRVVVLDHFNVAAVLEYDNEGRFRFNYNAGNIIYGTIDYSFGKIMVVAYRGRSNTSMEAEIYYNYAQEEFPSLQQIG